MRLIPIIRLKFIPWRPKVHWDGHKIIAREEPRILNIHRMPPKDIFIPHLIKF